MLGLDSRPKVDEKLINELMAYYQKKQTNLELTKSHAWIRYLHHIHNKVHDLQWNVLACCVGLPRTGKSLFATYHSYLLNKNFQMDRDVIYTPNEFTRRVKEISRVGETIIWDEAGVGMSARDWFKIQNKEIGKMLQTVGHLRPIIWFVSPDFSFIDAQPKKLFHYFYEMESRTADYTNVRAYNLKVNKKTGELYFYYPRFTMDGFNRITKVRFHKPENDFINAYKAYSDPRKHDLRDHSKKLLDKPKRKWDLNTIQKHVLAYQKDFIVDKEKSTIGWEPIFIHFQDHLKTAGNPLVQAKAIARVLNAQLEKERGIANGEQKETGESHAREYGIDEGTDD